MNDKDQIDVSRFVNWLNSIEIFSDKGINRDNFCVMMSDGMLFLKLMDYIQPGIVDWNKVKPHDDNMFKKISICKEVTSVMERIGLPQGLVKCMDIVKCNLKSILSLMWMLMREVFKRKHEVESEDDFLQIADKFLDVVHKVQPKIDRKPIESDEPASDIVFSVLYYGDEGEVIQRQEDQSELVIETVPIEFDFLVRTPLDKPIPSRIEFLKMSHHKLVKSLPKTKLNEGNISKEPQSSAPDKNLKDYKEIAQNSNRIVNINKSKPEKPVFSLVADLSPLFIDNSRPSSLEDQPLSFSSQSIQLANNQNKNKHHSTHSPDEEDKNNDHTTSEEEFFYISCKSTHRSSMRPRPAIIATNYNSRDGSNSQTDRSIRSQRVRVPPSNPSAYNRDKERRSPSISNLTDAFDLYSNRKKIMGFGSPIDEPENVNLINKYKSAGSNFSNSNNNIDIKGYRSEYYQQDKENFPLNMQHDNDYFSSLHKDDGEITFRSRTNVPRSVLKQLFTDVIHSRVDLLPLKPTLTGMILVPLMRSQHKEYLYDIFLNDCHSNVLGKKGKPQVPAILQLELQTTHLTQLKLAKTNHYFMKYLELPTQLDERKSRMNSPIASTIKDNNHTLEDNGPSQESLKKLELINIAAKLEEIILEFPDCQTKKSLSEILNKLEDFKKIPYELMKDTFSRLYACSSLSDFNKEQVKRYESTFFNKGSNCLKMRPFPPEHHKEGIAKPDSSFGKKMKVDRYLTKEFFTFEDKQKKSKYRELIKQRILSSEEQIERPKDARSNISFKVAEELIVKKYASRHA